MVLIFHAAINIMNTDRAEMFELLMGSDTYG
jgi:hypothetical protein